MLEDYRLSVASRFWRVAPWELEAHENADYWIARAVQFEKAESQARDIAMKAAEQRAKNKNG